MVDSGCLLCPQVNYLSNKVPGDLSELLSANKARCVKEHATQPTMAEITEKKPTEAVDEPRLPSNEIGQTSDADMALAAMGYKPVRNQ